MSLYADEGRARVAAALRWGLAGLLVVAVHGGAGWWVIRHPITQAAPDTVQGIAIDLEPVSVPQNAPEPNSTTAAGETAAPQAAAAPEPVSESPPPAAPPDPTPTEPPPPVVEPTPMPDPQPAPKVPPVVLPQQETRSDAVLAPPPKPRPTPPKPDPRVLAREAARKKAVAERREQQRAAHVEARAQAKAQAEQARQSGGQAPKNIAPSGASSGALVLSWRGAVVAHLNGFKPAAPNGATGTARVSFSVDRGGRVVSAALSGSSGDAALDAAAVAMVRRASPVPAPPPDLGGRIPLSVPVYFH